MEFGIEICSILVIKSGKRHLTDGMELSIQNNIRTFGEKEAHKYVGKLEAGTINQVEMKEKNKERVYQEHKKTTRDKTIWQKPYQRNKYLGCSPCKIFGAILEVDQKRT